ncbi:MAG: biopolymer transporter ExbD [Prevotella sp.]|nr:biopolymer transporter ExbD [Prevotella sp.]
MTLIRRTKRDVPTLTTATLPDLIFVVLFFFMAVTHMREVTLKVRYRVPEGTELTKLTRKSAVTYIYIGKPIDRTQGAGESDTHIQINDKFADMSMLVDYVTEERERMSPEDLQIMSVSVKADRDTEMGIISDVKEALTQAGVMRVNYSAIQKSKK